MQVQNMFLLQLLVCAARNLWRHIGSSIQKVDGTLREKQDFNIILLNIEIINITIQLIEGRVL